MAQIETATARSAASDLAHEKMTFKPGEILFHEGEKGGDLFIIEQGEVEIFIQRNDHEYHLARLGLREMIGVMSIANAESRSASARALSVVTVLVIRHQDVERLLKEIPTWALSFINDLTSRVRFANARFVSGRAQLNRNEDPDFGLKTGIHLVKSMCGIAGYLKQKSGETWYVDINNCSEAAISCLYGDEEQYRRVFQIIAESALFYPADVPLAGRFITLADMYHLSHFLRFASHYLERKAEGQHVLPLTIAERKCIDFLAQRGRASQKNVTEPVSMTLQEIEEATKQNSVPYSYQCLKHAEDYGMMRLTKTSETTIVTFVVDELYFTLVSMEVIRSLEIGYPAYKIKRTLLY